MHIFLFGDETAEQYSLLRSILNRKNNAVLTTFLEQVCVALRQETHKLPRELRECIPDFLRMTELVESFHVQGSKKSPALKSALVTTTQLAHYIG